MMASVLLPPGERLVSDQLADVRRSAALTQMRRYRPFRRRRSNRSVDPQPTFVSCAAGYDVMDGGSDIINAVRHGPP
jgi:hypothetical protein